MLIERNTRRLLLETFWEILLDICEEYEVWPVDVIRTTTRSPTVSSARHELMIRLQKKVYQKRISGKLLLLFSEPDPETFSKGEWEPLSSGLISKLLGLKNSSLARGVNRHRHVQVHQWKGEPE